MNASTFLSRYWLPATLLGIILTRLPFLLTGYGADADAWLVAHSASTLWHSGHYLESRLPGYPLHEIMSAPFVSLGGATASNSATLLVTLAAVLVWHAIAREHARHQKLLVISFAFAPVVWQNSAVTLDYMWSLFFGLLSLQAILNRRMLFAGIALGAAAGCRPSNLILIVPLLCLLHFRREGVKHIMVFVIGSSVISACAFLPLMLKYGIPGWFIATRLEMSDVHPELAMRFLAFSYRTIYFIGPLTTGIAGYIFWKNRSGLLVSVRTRDPLIIASGIGFLVVILLFFWLPLDRAYLLPALPFFLLLLDRCSSNKTFALFSGILILSGIVNIDVAASGNRRDPDLNIRWGMVVEELQNRKQMLEHRITIASLAPPGKSIIMTSGGPAFWFENDLIEPAADENLQRSILYTTGHFRLTQTKGRPNTLQVAYLTKDELDGVRNRGYQVYCLLNARTYVERAVGYSLKSMNVPLLYE